VSIGVGTITPTHEDASDAFLETIDQRLYRAKKGGRNRIVANVR
jgi:PleD family two-component response regulator